MSVSNGQKANAATFNAAFVSKTVATTKGDLLARSSTDLIRVGVGANGQVLTADSTEAAGVKWADATGGGGSGVGGINYITNFDAEVNTTGWTTYADAAGAQPVDGTGGTANITWTRTTTTPLRGVASFLFTKDAVNRQGQGASFNFNISEADKAKQMQITFDYAVVSGTYATGDLTCYIVHDPNGTPKVIQPSAFQIESVGSGTTGLARLTFQTEMSAQVDYNLCFHVASTSALAYSLEFDNILLGPQVVPLGAPVTDWVSYTPTGGWTGAVTYTGRWRRVGDSAEIHVRVTTSGTPTGTNLSINLPPGLAIDTSKLLVNALDEKMPSSAGTILDNGATFYDVDAYYLTTTSVLLKASNASGTYLATTGTVTPTVPMSWVSGDQLVITFKTPIVGWSSSTVVSSSADTRVVACRVSGQPNSTLTSGNFVKATWAASPVLLDTLGGWSTANNNYVVQIPGNYLVTGSADLGRAGGTVSQVAALRAVATGNKVAFFGFQGFTTAGSEATGCSGSAILYDLKVGDTIELQARVDGTTPTWQNNFTGGTSMSIQLIQGPSQIAASEVIAFQGTAPSNSISTSIIKVTGWTASLDTHASYNAANNRWICPAPGIYDLAVWLALQNTAIPSSVWIYINGIAVNGGKGQAYSNGSVYPVSSISLLRQLNAGDYIEIFAQAASSTTAIDAPSTSWKIKRLGGVM